MSPTHVYLTLAAAQSWFSHLHLISGGLLFSPGAGRGQRRCHPKDGLCSSMEHMAHAQPSGPISAQCGSACLFQIHPPNLSIKADMEIPPKAKPQLAFHPASASGMHFHTLSQGFTSYLDSRDQSSFEELGRRPSKAVSSGCSLGPGVCFEGESV